MSATVAGRSSLQLTAFVRSAVTSRLSPGILAKAASSPFQSSKQNPITHSIFRSPVELSCCVETMLPYHTATASALLTSKLFMSRRRYGWTPNGQIHYSVIPCLCLLAVDLCVVVGLLVLKYEFKIGN